MSCSSSSDTAWAALSKGLLHGSSGRGGGLCFVPSLVAAADRDPSSNIVAAAYAGADLLATEMVGRMSGGVQGEGVRPTQDQEQEPLSRACGPPSPASGRGEATAAVQVHGPPTARLWLWEGAAPAALLFNQTAKSGRPELGPPRSRAAARDVCHLEGAAPAAPLLTLEGAAPTAL